MGKVPEKLFKVFFVRNHQQRSKVWRETMNCDQNESHRGGLTEQLDDVSSRPYPQLESHGKPMLHM